MSLPAQFQNGKPEIGVLADGIAGPPAGGIERRATDETHGAVYDDGISLVALDHPDIEETSIFAVHRMVEWAAAAVAVVLRRLHQSDLGFSERRHQVGKPIRGHHIIRINDANYFGIRRSPRQGKPERPSFVA